MQSTKYLLLLLAVLAFAAMNAAAMHAAATLHPSQWGYITDNHAEDCVHYGKPQLPTAKMDKEDVRKCNACCILIGERYGFEIKYEMAHEPSIIGSCICMRSNTTKNYTDEEIRGFKALLGRSLAPTSLSRSRSARFRAGPSN
jgi:hypothetical protein